MTVSQISVFVENRPGGMAAFAHVLREHSIDLRALSVAEGGDYGIVRIIVDDVARASKVLKEADYVCTITPVIAVPMRDVSGGLAGVLEVLGQSGINIEYLYAFVARQHGTAYVIFRVIEVDKAIEALRANNYTPVSQEELKLDHPDA